MANKRLTGEPGARIKLGVVTRIGHGALRVAVALSLGTSYLGDLEQIFDVRIRYQRKFPWQD
jgi:hypothetical protein